MISRLWNFVKRHHRKGIITCAVVGGGVLLARYGMQKLQEQRQKGLAECVKQFQRGKHFDTTQQTCGQTVLSLVNSLRNVIVKKLDSDDLTLMLQSRPPNRLELWEELKVVAFTRVATSIYSTAVLALILRIQINVVGASVYLHENTDSSFMSCFETQEKYLECVQNFLNVGVNQLIDLLKTTVEKVVKSISLKDKLKLVQIEAIFNKIRMSFETDETRPLRNVNKFILNDAMFRDGEDLSLVYSETLDILCTEDCYKVITDLVSIGFAHLSDLLTQFFMQLVIEGSGSFSNPHEIVVPLAKLIPVLNNFVFTQCSDQPKQLVANLLHCASLKAFGANIYDAFSQKLDNIVM